MQRRKSASRIIGRYLGWLAIRVAIIIVIFVLLESAYRFDGFSFAGSTGNQELVYLTLQKVLFSVVVWFFLAFSQKILIPSAVITFAPVLGKIVHDRTSAQKTNKAITRYLTYLVYIIAIIALILIWAYAFIGTWVASILGSTLVIGLAFILGIFSSSILGNVLGYAVLGGTNEFKEGDHVQIGDSCGEVVEVGVFFTRIKTIQDEIISIPNLTVMGKEIRNFSALKEVGIRAQITLGYDVDEDKVQAILIEAAQKTTGVLFSPDKAPSVLFRELGPSSITYELNVFTNEPNKLVQIKSDLIRNMLVELKKAGIDITSSTYVTIRNQEKTLPQPVTQYLDRKKANS